MPISLTTVGFLEPEDAWDALVNRYGLTNAKYMVETVFGLSPFVINGINNEEKDSTTM